MRIYIKSPMREIVVMLFTPFYELFVTRPKQVYLVNKSDEEWIEIEYSSHELEGFWKEWIKHAAHLRLIEQWRIEFDV